MADTKNRGKKPRTVVPIQEARPKFKELLNRVEFRGERIVITRYGEESVALVSLDDLAKLEQGAA